MLTSQGKIQANGVDLDVGSNACAVVVDWNNDNRKVLIIGNQDYQVRVYLNSGTNPAPVFTSYTVVIYSESTLFRNSPEVLDLNGDGKKDLIVGEEFGYVFYYENIGTDAMPSFSNHGDTLKLDNGSSLCVPKRAHIDIVDWNGDGVEDIIVGDNDGYFYLFINSRGSPLIDNPTQTSSNTYVLYQAYPNPFNPRTIISYYLPHTTDIKLMVYNELGQMVQNLVSSRKEAGYHQVCFDASTLSSGVYFYRLETEIPLQSIGQGFVETKKMILMK